MRRRKQDFDPLACAQQIVDNVLKKAFTSAEEVLAKGVRVDYVMKLENGEKQRTALHQVAEAGDLEGIEWLAGKGAIPNIPMEQGVTLLHFCVLNDKLAVLQKLCELAEAGTFRSLDLSKRSNADETATQLAINLHKVDLAKILIKAGSNHDFNVTTYPNPSGGEPLTQLQHACCEGSLELMDTIFDLGKSPIEQDTEGNTLLHLSARHKQWAAVDLLLEKGVPITAKNCAGSSVLTMVLLESDTPHDDAVQLIQKGLDVNADDDSGHPPLHYAIMAQDKDLISLFLEHGALISKPDCYGNVALHKAARLDDAAILQKITSLDEKKNGELKCNAANHKEETALHVTCLYDRPTNATHILTLPGVCQNTQTNDGSTPLHVAAKHGSVACAAVLLSKNIETKEDTPPPGKKPAPKGKKDPAVGEEVKKTDIEAVDKEGNTPLQIAMQHNMTDVVKVLIENQASVQRGSKDHGTLLHQSIKAGTFDITKSLIEGGASVHIRDTQDNAPIHIAVRVSCANTVNLLISNGAYCDCQDEKEGLTPLHIAAMKDNAEIVKILLQNKVALEARDHKCYTALHYTAQKSSVNAMKVLLDAKAELDPLDLACRTPLHHACEEGNADAVAELIARGSDIGAKDNNGWSPIHVTSFAGRYECSQLLIDAGAKINETDKKDRIPFLLASESCKVDVARLLVNTWKEQKEAC